MFDRHFQWLGDPSEFANSFLLPRLRSTVSYRSASEHERVQFAAIVSQAMSAEVARKPSGDKRLGILMIFDPRLDVFAYGGRRDETGEHLWIGESMLEPGKHLHLKGDIALQLVSEARFLEASELGREKHAISTFTNRKSDEVVAVYNRSWLWLSPTWDLPKSIYWKDNEWTKGVKIDRKSYEAFLNGAQLIKQLTRPLSNAVLKEIFSPITNAEARSRPDKGNFERIYGAPMIVPLLDRGYEISFNMIESMLREQEVRGRPADLHLSTIGGIELDIEFPESADPDEFRLVLLYYSGELSRGDVHIRALIEDVIPSVARKLDLIVRELKDAVVPEVQSKFEASGEISYRYENLLTLFGNAYGPGYVWSALRDALHGRQLYADRIVRATAAKLTELAKKEDTWGMKKELTFLVIFLSFLDMYNESIRNETGKGEDLLSQWDELMRKYHDGELREEDLDSPEKLGFVTGLLMRQFHNAFWAKTEKDFLKSRVLQFGNKLTPDMIWKDGVLRCKELAIKWSFNPGKMFDPNYAVVCLAFDRARQENWLTEKFYEFLNMFWAGYLLYKNPKKEESTKGEESA